MTGQPSDFDRFDAALARGGPAEAFECLVEQFRRTRSYHQLFDARLAQCRARLGLQLHGPSDLESLAEPLRSQVEEGYLAACREVGQLLLDAGEYRSAWLYLRPAGEKDRMRKALEQAQVNDENAQELVELSLYEGVAPELGFGLVLARHGTCNAITTFESIVHAVSRENQQRLAGRLVRHLHGELLANLRADFAEHDPAVAGATLSQLVGRIEGQLGEFYCHVDASHLGSVVRYARLLTDPVDLRMARELTEYGRRLHQNFLTAGEEPFVDTYASHGLFFAAQLGDQIEEAVRFFRERAESVDARQYGTAAIEVYAVLLARLGRHAEAMHAMTLVPPGVGTSRFAPSLADLSEQAGDFSTWEAIARERGDLMGYAIAKIQESTTPSPEQP